MEELVVPYHPIESTQSMLQEFTSTGSKIEWHRDIIEGLHEGKGVPKVTGIFVTDICQHTCAFCSTANRAREILDFHKIQRYVEQLVPLGLKAVILSGGGNPIMYRCKTSGKNFNDLVEYLHEQGLEIGLISNGMKMKEYPCGRKSWVNVSPETLDKLTWIRISLSAWDHDEEVEVPDINPDITSLGGSWVYHDQFFDPANRHGKVSQREKVVIPILPEEEATRIRYGKDRFPFIKEKMRELVKKHPWTYIRALPDCYCIDQIPARCKELEQLSLEIDSRIIVQYKPPSPHTVCLLGYAHPVLWPSGQVTPCDSITLLDENNRSQGNSTYVIATWEDIGELYRHPVKSLIDPMVHCKKCVFGANNRLLDKIWKGYDPRPTGTPPRHVNFI